MRRSYQRIFILTLLYLFTWEKVINKIICLTFLVSFLKQTQILLWFSNISSSTLIKIILTLQGHNKMNINVKFYKHFLARKLTLSAIIISPTDYYYTIITKKKILHGFYPIPILFFFFFHKASWCNILLIAH